MEHLSLEWIETKHLIFSVVWGDPFPGGKLPEESIVSGLIRSMRSTASFVFYMEGGGQDVFERVLPVFDKMGKNVSYMGEHGAGQVAKASNQIIVALTIEAGSRGPNLLVIVHGFKSSRLHF